MSAFERLATDYRTQGHTTGPHPMALWRRQYAAFRVQRPDEREASTRESPDPTVEHSTRSTLPTKAADFIAIPHGQHITVAGQVICRQRPGTAKGHCFISLEDETGIANLFVPRDTFHRYRIVITTEPFLLCHGRMQVGEGGTCTLYTTAVDPLPFPVNLQTSSHDFH